MRHRSLILQTALFAVNCYVLLWFCVWAIHFRIPRALFAITVALICLTAETLAAYFVLRQLWRWSGVVTRRFLKNKKGTAAEVLLTEQR